MVDVKGFKLKGLKLNKNIITARLIENSISADDLSSRDYYGDGTLLGGIVGRRISIRLKDGTEIVPAYEAADVRKKFRNSIEYYRSGRVRSLYLQDAIEVETVVGKVQAELITFHENGLIKKIFPLYGQISAYWSEEQESEEAPVAAVSFAGKTHDLKVESLTFFEDGNIKSIDFWRNTNIKRSNKDEH